MSCRLEDGMKELFLSKDLLSTLIDQEIIDDANETIKRLFPDKNALAGSFFRVYMDNDIATLEVSLLSKKNYIIDLTFNSKSRATSILKINPSTIIILNKYYSEETPDISETKSYKEPYRVELNINMEDEGLHYYVEGQANVVLSLIEYFELLVNAFQQQEGVK
jgi:hypothetical protein